MEESSAGMNDVPEDSTHTRHYPISLGGTLEIRWATTLDFPKKEGSGAVSRPRSRNHTLVNQKAMQRASPLFR